MNKINKVNPVHARYVKSKDNRTNQVKLGDTIYILTASLLILAALASASFIIVSLIELVLRLTT